MKCWHLKSTQRTCYSRLYTGTLRTDWGPTVLSVPTSEDLKSNQNTLSCYLPLELFLRIPNPIAKCKPRCRAPDAGMPCKLRKVGKFRSLSFKRFLVCTSSWMPLESKNSHFSSDSSRKWPSQLLLGENLDSDRSWRGALQLPSCAEECLDRWPSFVSDHHSLEWGTIPHCRLLCCVAIGESATRRVILPMDFSLLSW
jgi:hypothetical protein